MTRNRWLWAILLLGAAVRLPGLGARSLSYDECQQYWASQGDVLLANRAITLDPPGFAALLRVHSLAGDSEIWLRLLPCLLGILGIPAVYALARAAGRDEVTARIAAFFFALAPYPIRYSQSLRVYSATLLACAALAAAFLHVLGQGSSPRRGALVALGLATFASMLVMYGAVWLVLGCAVWTAWSALRGGGGSAGRTLGAIAAGAAAAIPFYAFSLPAQLREGTPASFYDDKFLPREGLGPAIRFLASGTVDLFAYYSFILPITGLVFGALAVYGLVRLARSPRGAAPAFLFAAGVAAAAAASGFRLYPYGGTRQMLFAAPLFYLAAAEGFGSLRARARGALVLAGVAAVASGSGVFLYRYHTGPGRQDLRPVIASLAQARRSTDRILVNRDAVPQFRYYFRDDPSRVVFGEVSVVRDFIAEMNAILASDPRSRWWLVVSHGWNDERRARLAQVDPRFRLEERFEAPQAGAYLFVPADASAAGSDP
jgi:hypothetical protein